MSISDMTDSYGDDEREDPVDGEQGEDAPFEDEDAPFAEEEAQDSDDDVLQDEELPLADEEALLPWLEGDEDEEDYDGYTTGQTLGLIGAVTLVLALVAGGIWWFVTLDGPDADLIADGSTIKSEGPYKQRPDDPGGKVFEGTGDSSFKVSEGQSNPARLGQADSKPEPGFETLGQAAKDPKDKSPNGKPAAGTGAGATDSPGVGVQISAYSNRASAETGWGRLSAQYGALKGLRHRVVEGKVDGSTVYRLQAIADDKSAASKLCSGLKSSGLNCYVKP
ncbi:MAG: SPOR domain-containing protein [Novosphingobium sp.]|nr:SPOR domain-containing protein [Novosphingobium sp.]